MRIRTIVISWDLRVLILIEDIEQPFKLWPVMQSIDLATISLKRRRVMRIIAGFFALSITPVIGARRTESLVSDTANQAAKFNVILAELLGKSPKMVAHPLSLEIPSVAENGALVPLTMTGSADVESLYLLAEGNPGPLLAEFHFRGTALPKVSLRVKLNQSGPVTALSHTQSGWVRLDRDVRVAIGGCG